MADPKPQQLKLSLGNVNARQFAPVPEAQRGAREYAKSRGRKYSTEGLANVQADPQSQFRLQHAFRQKMASGPQSSPGIQRSYSALSGAIEDQHEYMTKTLGITHEVVDHDPYKGPEELADDIKTNKRIKTLSSASTSDDTEQALPHDVTDKFRAVHDFFGHAATGRGFSRHGEEAAFRSHIQMFPPEAHQAATAELRAQNAHLNYAPEGGFPDLGGRAVGVPDWAMRPR
jgi:uncharacterized protein YifE (UPF0438 family)